MKHDPGEIVADLLRNANGINRASTEIIDDLLFRSIVAIRDLRRQAGIPESGTRQDAIIRLAEVAAGSDRQEEAARRDALLEAADLIRTLNVVVKSGISLRLTEVIPDETGR